tara:strand:- start:797 stop:1867 length:1071 start_codon:yes stop_codon:yes gene_type:complete
LNKNKEEYLIQFDEKKRDFSSFFSNYTDDLKFFQSPPTKFRTRAEFGVVSTNSFDLTMVENGNKIFIDQLDICNPNINQIITHLKKEIILIDTLKEKLFQVEIQVSRKGDSFICLVYHKFLDTNWMEKAKILSKKIQSSIIGRSKNQKLVIGKDYVIETYDVNGDKFQIKLYEQCFSQPNPDVCDHILSWVSLNPRSKSDVVELHCGLGTFTVILSQMFSKVLCTENSRPSIKALEINMKDNYIYNVAFGRLSGIETLDALNSKREFTRLQHVDLQDYKIDTLFLDPPRSGLDSLTVDLIKQIDFKKLIYLSCNFQSLKSNVLDLISTYQVEKAAFFDQFPFTDHMEIGVILKKKS